MAPIDRRSLLVAFAVAPLAGRVLASPVVPGFVFASIDGGDLDLADLRGGPVLVVNTASRCMNTPQYDGLQALWERYRDRGLTVLGVPSPSFGQELESARAVKAFCELNFAIDFPMTGLVEVKGPEAHPFYAWAAEQGHVPAWNFTKILLDGEGRIVGQFDTETEPDAPELIAAIEALLPKN